MLWGLAELHKIFLLQAILSYGYTKLREPHTPPAIQRLNPFLHLEQQQDEDHLGEKDSWGLFQATNDQHIPPSKHHERGEQAICMWRPCMQVWYSATPRWSTQMVDHLKSMENQRLDVKPRRIWTELLYMGRSTWHTDEAIHDFSAVNLAPSLALIPLQIIVSLEWHWH